MMGYEVMRECVGPHCAHCAPLRLSPLRLGRKGDGRIFKGFNTTPLAVTGPPAFSPRPGYRNSESR